jgi:two-component system alkaline phosphatase synthesis response regulator PhoP
MDVMMPEMDGIEAARQIKSTPEFKNTLILFLTARGEEYTEIAAFESGATDYVVKPIKLRALISRINALLTREPAVPESKNDRISIGDLIIDRVQYAATFQGRALVLPKKEFELLSFLAQYPNKVFSRDEILQKIWGADVFVVERTIDVHIRKVREKVGETFIKTLKGVGYMFTDEV